MARLLRAYLWATNKVGCCCIIIPGLAVAAVGTATGVTIWRFA